MTLCPPGRNKIRAKRESAESGKDGAKAEGITVVEICHTEGTDES
jgi:hypothetical protein